MGPIFKAIASHELCTTLIGTWKFLFVPEKPYGDLLKHKNLCTNPIRTENAQELLIQTLIGQKMHKGLGKVAWKFKNEKFLCNLEKKMSFARTLWGHFYDGYH